MAPGFEGRGRKFKCPHRPSAGEVKPSRVGAIRDLSVWTLNKGGPMFSDLPNLKKTLKLGYFY